MKATGYTVIYLWQGNRHRAGVFLTLDSARHELTLFLRDGWRAWVEEL